MRLRGSFAVLLLCVSVMAPVLGATPAHGFARLYVGRTFFYYCNYDLSTAKLNRFEDGLTTWFSRVPGLTATPGCGGAAVNLKIQDIDAGKQWHLLASSTDTQITFDSNEQWWNTRGLTDCNHADFWAVAAHEIGHEYVLGHPWYVPTSGDLLPTMLGSSDHCDVNGVDDLTHLGRDLAADDEAGMKWNTTGLFVPTASFEATTDCVSTVECVGDFYWTEDGTTQNCSANVQPYAGSCVEKLPDAGGVSQVITFHAGDATGGIATYFFHANNRGQAATTLTGKVEDVTTTPHTTLRTFSCNIPGNQSWINCNTTWFPDTTGMRKYKFSITRAASGPTIWLDSVNGTGDIAEGDGAT